MLVRCNLIITHTHAYIFKKEREQKKSKKINKHVPYKNNKKNQKRQDKS